MAHSVLSSKERRCEVDLHQIDLASKRWHRTRLVAMPLGVGHQKHVSTVHVVLQVLGPFIRATQHHKHFRTIGPLLTSAHRDTRNAVAKLLHKLVLDNTRILNRPLSPSNLRNAQNKLVQRVCPHWRV
jgi:hypothetical protein